MLLIGRRGLAGKSADSLAPANQKLVRRRQSRPSRGIPAIRHLPVRCRTSAADVELTEELAKDREVEDPEEAPAAAITEDLVIAFAYLLWAENGRPAGAEYAPMSRELLQQEIDSGRDIADLEHEIYKRRADLDDLDLQLQREEEMWKTVEPARAQWNYRPIWAQDSAPKPAEPVLPAGLSDELLVELKLARGDSATVYTKLFAYGDGSSHLLAVLRAAEGPDGPCTWEITRDAAANAEDLVLHWGVSCDAARAEWTRPAEGLLPKGSTLPEEGISAETTFEPLGGGGGLARAAICMEPGHGVTGLQFVLRSADSSEWWQDGAGNFKLPLPLPYTPPVAAAGIAYSTLPPLPDELVNVQSYLLWIEAGRPDGADFSKTSGERLMDELRSGRSLADLEQEIYSQRDAPLLSQVRANPDGVIYSMMFKFGATGRLLAVLREPSQRGEGYSWEIITDTLKDVVLHWGVCREGDMSDWARPAYDLLPGASDLFDGSTAADTRFVAAAAQGLKRIDIAVPRKCRITGVQFVLRLEDGSRWWQDGPENFKLPLPLDALPEEEEEEEEAVVVAVEEVVVEEEEDAAEAAAEANAALVDMLNAEEQLPDEIDMLRSASIAEENVEADVPDVPQELVEAKAHLLWIAGGEEDGADFTEQSRAMLITELLGGRSLDDLSREIYRIKAFVEMDTQVELAQHDGLLLHVFEFGDGDRLLAVLREGEDGSFSYELVTNSADAVLHWGVCRAVDLSDWASPAAIASLPEATECMENGISAETRFAPLGDGSLLRSLRIEVQPGDRVVGLQFVLRSENGACWWMDGSQNFKLGLPFAPLEEEEEEAEAAAPGEIEAPKAEDELPDELVFANAHLLWINSGRPMGADFSELSRTVLKEQIRTGRSLEQLEKEIYTLKEEADARDREQAEALRELESMLTQDLVNTNAYLVWVDSGRPEGADFSQASRENLMKELLDGRDLAELEDEVFSRKAELDALAKQEVAAAAEAELEKANAAWQNVTMGSALQLLRSRPAMELMQHPGVQMEFVMPKVQSEAFAKKLESVRQDSYAVAFRVFEFGPSSQLLAILWAPGYGRDACSWELIVDAEEDVVLHWGVSFEDDRSDWTRPDESILPASSVLTEGIAAETWFEPCEDCSLKHVIVTPPASMGVTGMQFVLRSEDESEWYQHGASNFSLAIRKAVDGHLQLSEMEQQFSNNPVGLEIAEAENQAKWTLMHRYNKASEILEALLTGHYSPQMDPVDAVAHIYVWLRFSANRHITWQRNYNTQPRILTAAQDRLIKSISKAHAASSGETQEWARLCLSTIGRGGDGQRIRDEILNIMHRNGIKEIKGTWMEEWHQKLHNNTTPDDIYICEAYLTFLSRGGDNAAYWEHLNKNGITRERMESFERPIIAEPEDFHWMRDALIGDLNHYLDILKSVHGGTDLFSSAQRADWAIPSEVRGYLDFVMGNLHGPVLPLIEAAVEARTELRPRISGNLDLLYLDLALEGTIRWAAEKAAGVEPLSAVQMIGPLLQNLVLTAGDNEELCYSLAAWNALPVSLRTGHKPESADEALMAAATVDRIRHSLGSVSDIVSKRIEPISIQLGAAFGVEDWTVRLFAEEVVRGGPAFAVSQALKSVDVLFRQLADMGDWQVISPGAVMGVVVVEPELYAVQNNMYAEPTILVVNRVSGEEEIPQGCVAVLTPDAPDVLSHVSVRARNTECLFATCYNDEEMEQLRGHEGETLSVITRASGGIQWECVAASDLPSASLDQNGSSVTGSLSGMRLSTPSWCGKWCIGLESFSEDTVGAKSRSVAALCNAVPNWIQLPSSVTIPFGTFEHLLETTDANRAIGSQLQEALKGVEDDPQGALKACRDLVMRLEIPDSLKDGLWDCIAEANIPTPATKEEWEGSLEAMKGVWASKYNDRAYFAMRKAGLPFNDIRMAVLVMPVIRPEYAFVIHTTNPITNDQDEIYCELVRGLGEVLVSGQFPGRAMAFSARKNSLDEPVLLAYPSKSQQMVAGSNSSLIFRSDSNGEDLASFAGAGLFDSITAQESEIRPADYTEDRITTDAEFRKHIMQQICKVGAAIEAAMGSPQDIEGVVDANGNVTVVQSRPQV